jgi:beta-hydroxyacyl-ACP dehydratase FabZ
MAEQIIFDSVQIQSILLHRYPFLLVDRVVEFEENKRIVGIKNVTANEPFFQGHFPGRPVMPGVLMLEAIAQTGAILCLRSSNGAGPGRTILLVGADDFRWKKMVQPGDTLRIAVEVVKARRNYWMNRGEITVDGSLVASGNISAIGE